jgi:hypothetical protein
MTPRGVVFVVLFALTIAVIVQSDSAFAQQANPAHTDVASYDIEARLDPDTHQIAGTAAIVYRNPSSDTLEELWFRLYLNAFRSPETLWMREAGAGRRQGFSAEDAGWVRLDRLVLADTGEDLLPAGAAGAETVLRVALPRPLGPGETLRLAASWTSQLPRIVARTGYVDDFVMAGQWYPKLAVYDRGAWDSEPWHANAEFFADFGTYNLALTVPRAYVTAAGGVREETTENADGTTTTRYRAERVSDIAWTAWPGYRTATRSVEAAGQRVELELLTPTELADADERYFRAAQVALDRFGRWFGPYPWPRLTLIVPPAWAPEAGGMEYPTLVTLGEPIGLPFGLGEAVYLPEIVTVHEIAHQWAPLQVATDEGREAWLDEGLADYAATRVLDEMFGEDSSLIDLGPLEVGYAKLSRLQLGTAARLPLALASWEYGSMAEYVATVYGKGALTFESLEHTLGEERFLTALRLYIDRWRWRHPTTADLQAALEEGAGEELDWLFEPVVYGRGVVEYRVIELDDARAIVERRGEVRFPVDVRMTYEDGRVDLTRWDGQSDRLELLAWDGRFRRVEVDPDRHAALELNALDNGVTDESVVIPATTAASRALGLIQMVLQLFGLVG